MPFLLHGVLKSCMLLWAALLYIAMSWHATRPPFPNNTVLARLHLITDRHEGGAQPPGVFALSHPAFALRSPLTDRWEEGDTAARRLRPLPSGLRAAKPLNG